MAANHQINIHFASKFEGEGFNKLNGALRGSASGIRRFGSIFSNVTSLMDTFGDSAGQLGRTITSLVGSALSGGVWGLVATGITSAVSLIVGWFDKARERAQKVSDAYDEIIKSEFAKQSEIRAARIKAEAEAWDRANRNIAEYTKAVKSLEKEYANTERHEKYRGVKNGNLKEAIEVARTNEKTAQNNYTNAQLDLSAAKNPRELKEREAALSKAHQEFLNAQQKRIVAEKDLADAEEKERQETAKAAQAERQKAETAAANAMEEKKEKDEKLKRLAEQWKAEEKRRVAEERIATRERERDEKDAALRSRLAAAEKASAQWQANDAANPAGGKTYGEWKHDQAAIDKAARKAAKRDQKQLDEARRNLANTNRALDTAQSYGEVQNLLKERDRLETFIAQKEGNSAAKDADTIRDEIAKNIKDSSTYIKDIRDELKGGV